MISLRLPWEVIERVIEHAHDDLDLLHSFSLTCKQLRPRSFALIIAHHVFLDSRDCVSAFSGFIEAEKKLQPFVRSIIISPADFRPFPLVNMLPRLSTLLFTPPGYRKYKSYIGPNDRGVLPYPEIHHATINCYHLFGRRIHTLSLDHLSFQTSSDLYRLLLAFPMMTQLSCNDIFIKTKEKEAPAMTVLKRRLSNRLQLDTLHVRIYS